MGAEIQEPLKDDLEDYFVESSFIFYLSLLFTRPPRLGRT